MSRDFFIAGETLVLVRGGQHLSGHMSTPKELGLTDRDGIVKISPIWYHYDKRIDDYGPSVPAEVIQNIAECRIEMTLVHYDARLLYICMAESMGGSPLNLQTSIPVGTFVPAGRPLGGYKPIGASGNHYIVLTLRHQAPKDPLLVANRFLATYLMAPPLEIPFGTRTSHVKLQWRAIPYNLPGLIPSSFSVSGVLNINDLPFVSGKEILSSGAVLWDHILDP
jgi:hypothetical protein